MKEHNETLKAVLQRAETFGITFNKEKCVFGVDEIDFYGYRFTKEGLEPSHERVKTVKEIPQPESKEAVRSFLGMVDYVPIKIYRQIRVHNRTTEEATREGVKFKWGPSDLF